MRRTEEAARRELFCVLAARGFSPEEAARRAGYPDHAAKAAELLCEVKVRRRIARLCRELAFCAPAVLARAGLERLALGEADGVGGLLAGGDVATAELFHVAEVKLPKGGGVEVKFFDRVKALALLAELPATEEAPTGGLLEALTRSAQAMDGGWDADA